MNKEELIGKLQMVYVGDRNALNELIGYYDGLKEVIGMVQQENAELKKEINKISKKEVKVRDMLYSIENGTLTRERLSQIEEVLFEMESNNEN